MREEVIFKFKTHIEKKYQLRDTGLVMGKKWPVL